MYTGNKEQGSRLAPSFCTRETTGDEVGCTYSQLNSSVNSLCSLTPSLFSLYRIAFCGGIHWNIFGPVLNSSNCILNSAKFDVVFKRRT